MSVKVLRLVDVWEEDHHAGVDTWPPHLTAGWLTQTEDEEGPRVWGIAAWLGFTQRPTPCWRRSKAPEGTRDGLVNCGNDNSTVS
jgi:hypothetical protein